MGFAFSHDGRVTVNTDTLDLSDARRTIRAEHEPEQLGHEIVEFLAVGWIGMVGAFSAGFDVFLDAARAHGAPSSFCVLVAAFALSIQMRPAGSTVKAAISDHFRHYSNILHEKLLKFLSRSRER